MGTLTNSAKLIEKIQNIKSVVTGSTAPSNPSEGDLWYDTTNDQLKVYDGANWNVTGKEYNAGEGIEIGTAHSDMQGPAPDGFHVPLDAEWDDIFNALGLTNDAAGSTKSQTALHLPMAGYRTSRNDLRDQGSSGYYWSSSVHPDPIGIVSGYAQCFFFQQSQIYSKYGISRGNGCAVRCFKDSPVTPDSSWTEEMVGVFHNATLGLISIVNGTSYITLMDKNLGATTVWNYGDTVSEANCGGYFQWGNNYMFPYSGTITTSGTQVDASTYGPGNYYSSSTFITNGQWDSSDNANLRGGVTQGTWIGGTGNTIANTGVLSVNGQTGDVTISAGSEIVYCTQAEYDALPSSKLTDGKSYVIYE